MIQSQSRRFLSNNVEHNGKKLGLCYVELSDGIAKVNPFTHELHSTSMVDKIILVTDKKGNVKHLEIL